MGLLDNLLGDDGKSERSLTLKSKPTKDKDGVQNLYDPKGKSLPDSQTADYGSGRQAKVGVPSVSVPAMRAFGFLPEGPSPLDAAIQERNMLTGAYEPRGVQLPGFLNGALDVMSSPIQWLMNQGVGAMMPQPIKRQQLPVWEVEANEAAERERQEAYKMRLLQERINNQ